MTTPATKWVRFSWEITSESKLEKTTPKPYGLGLAESNDHEELRYVIDKALSLDPSWNPVLHEISERVDRTLEKALEKTDVAPLVLRHGTRVIGATILDPTAEEQFAIGPCVLMEYRNRGFGTLLLAAALRHLRDAGVKQVNGVTLANSFAARFLYPKFNGKSLPDSPVLAA